MSTSQTCSTSALDIRTYRQVRLVWNATRPPLARSISEGSNDEVVAIRVKGLLPVIVWDAEVRERRVVKMQWGFRDPRDWRRPRPIHARAETVEAKEPFRKSFHNGQCGSVVFRMFNEGEEVMKPSGKTSHGASPSSGNDSKSQTFQSLCWRAVMVTVPANDLIRRTVKTEEDGPRMPAILEDDAWSIWLGEDNATPASAKAVLKTMEGVNWQAAPEPKKPRPPKL